MAAKVCNSCQQAICKVPFNEDKCSCLVVMAHDKVVQVISESRMLGKAIIMISH